LIILGIDPGIASTGYGVIRAAGGGSISLVDYGVITTSPSEPHVVRLKHIYEIINGIINDHQPDAVAIETIFHSRNLKSLANVSEAIGVISLAAGNYGINIQKFTPLEIKSAIVRSGKAGKGQIQEMVKTILSLDSVPKPDHASDALAIAICCRTNVLYSKTVNRET
jgi:crossover junction endodeoxyribonuclease RuvC